MTTTRTRSRGHTGSRASAARAGAERRPMIVASVAGGVILLAFAALVTSIGHIVLAATDHFMLKYSGVFALMLLTGTACMGVLATDRTILNPGHRVIAQAVHRAVAFGTLAFLVVHIVLEMTAPHLEESRTLHVHVLDAFIPFLSQYRTFYMAEGTIASDLIILLIITGILRRRFTVNGNAWKWRAIHYTNYAALILGVLHGLLAGRKAIGTFVYWSYGAVLAMLAIAVLVRILATSLRSKDMVAGAAPLPGNRGSRSAQSMPVRAAALGLMGQMSGAVPLGGQPPYGTGPQPVHETGPQPAYRTGPEPAHGGGPQPLDGTGPQPALGTGPRTPRRTGPQSASAYRPMPEGRRGTTGPQLLYPPSGATGPQPVYPAGSRPDPGTGPQPVYPAGSRPDPGTGPQPVYPAGSGPAPERGRSPFTRPDPGPAPERGRSPSTRTRPRPGTRPRPLRPSGSSRPRTARGPSPVTGPARSLCTTLAPGPAGNWITPRTIRTGRIPVTARAMGRSPISGPTRATAQSLVIMGLTLTDRGRGGRRRVTVARRDTEPAPDSRSPARGAGRSHVTGHQANAPAPFPGFLPTAVTNDDDLQFGDAAGNRGWPRRPGHHADRSSPDDRWARSVPAA